MSKEEVILQTGEVRVRILELLPGEATPFHFHSEIDDHIFCLTGVIGIELQGPHEEVWLRPGERCRITRGRRHRVDNRQADGASTYLLVQGVGNYDFNRIETA